MPAESFQSDVELPAAVTFLCYLDDGRLQLQLRSFSSPDGREVVDPGLLSINGGAMESSDIVAELAREIREELGIDVCPTSVPQITAYCGSQQDPERKRTNYIFRLTQGYETLLSRSQPREVMKIIFNPEGIGRAAVWEEDLNDLITHGRLTRISRQILESLPDLRPPRRASAKT